MTTTVRAATPDDRGALLALFQAAFGAPASLDEWRWKYDENPRPGVSAVLVKDGEILGHYGGLGTRYVGSSESSPGVSAVDVMTHPSVRTLSHRSAFTELGEGFSRLNRDRGVPFYFGFPHRRHSVVSARLLKTTPIEPAGLLVRPLVAPRGLVSGLRRRLRRMVRGPGVSAGYAHLAETLLARPGLRTDRSREVLDWRLRRPGAGYEVLETLDRASRTKALAIVRVLPERALLVDLQAVDERGGALADLLDTVAQRFAPAARRLEIRLPSSSTLGLRLVGELGFVREEPDTQYELRLLDPLFDRAAAACLEYRYLDHDIF